MRPSRDLHLHGAISASAVLVFFSASVLLSAVPAARAQQETNHEEEFSYSLDAENGPAHWSQIKEEWSACGKGEMQLPIDLASPRVSLVRRLGHLNHSYAPANASIVNRGHDIMEMEKNARPRQELNSRDISMFRPIQQNRNCLLGGSSL